MVVGGSGFIGSHLVHHLADEGRHVRVLGRDPNKFRLNIGELEGVELYLGDVLQPAGFQSALEDVSDVVYLAFSTVPASSMRDLRFDLESNVVSLIGFLEALQEHPSVRRFVYISSGGTVYGNPALPERIVEDHATFPISSYGLTKLTSEHYVRLCLADSAIQAYILRPSNAYGERQDLGRNQGAMGHFLRSLAQDVPITVYGDGGVVRDFVYAGDLARAVALCLTSDGECEIAKATFNVGSGVETSIAQLIDLIEHVTGKQFSINRLPARDFDCTYNVLDISKISDALGWQPQVSLEEGILRTWDWTQRQYK